MTNIDTKGWKRNPTLVKSKIKNKNNILIADDDLYIMFPSKFIDKHLSTIDSTSHIVGILTISDDNDNYTVMNIPGRFKVTPDAIEDIMVDDIPYTKFTIFKGGAIMDSTDIIQNGDLIFEIFDYLVMGGKVPWFLGYEDLYNLFINVPKYTGASIGKDTIPFEVLIAIIARNDKDLKEQYRYLIKDRKELLTKIPEYVGLQSPYHSFNSTVSKLVGSYMKKGITSAIISPESEVTNIERVLRAK